MIVPTRQSLMFRARSYMAFVLSPQPLIENWLADLDASITIDWSAGSALVRYWIARASGS
jgi:hypothetical protein